MPGFQTPITIQDVLNKIHYRELVLPAIQRDFVWSAAQIEKLFDSLMKGYPISSFLFWSVNANAVGNYKFYNFLRCYREDFCTHGPECDPNDGIGVRLAVLDGQQRITSLYIALYGSYAERVSYGRINNDDEQSRPTRKLYLNISKKLEVSEQEDAREYQFEFKTEQESQKWADLYEDADNNYWFRVGKITEFDTMQVTLYWHEHEALRNSRVAFEILSRLHSCLTAPIINYYLVDDNDLNKALNIFIRINSGGTELGIADIILSIAISYWKGDAKKAFDDLIHNIATQYAEQNFNITHEFILRAFLVLNNNMDIGFKATNFGRETAHELEENWNKLAASIKATFELIRSYGYDGRSLRGYNSLIPITYYIYKKQIWENVCSATAYRADREEIKRWLHIVNIGQAFGRASNSMLVKSRRVLRATIEQGQGFPATALVRELGVSFSEEDIGALLCYRKDDRRTFPVLALLFPHLEYSPNAFHKDHMHSSAEIARYREANEILPEDMEYYQMPEWWDSIPNLQLLNANENQSKQDNSLQTWIDEEVKNHGKDRDCLMERCYIPMGIDLGIGNFKEFLLKRRELLRAALKEKLTLPD